MEMATIYELIGVLSQANAFFSFLALGITLILVDYYFPIDWPAYVGYLCFGFAVFFSLVESLVVSALGGGAVFVTMLVLHVLFFSRYLTNAPADKSSEGSQGSKAKGGAHE